MPRFRIVITVLIAILLPSLVLAQSAPLRADSSTAGQAGRLTSASNVRLRSEPVESAPVVVSLPLGTPLVGIEAGGEERAWLRVRTADGKEGWVIARLTRRFDADKKHDVVEGIVSERLARRGDSLAARAEVVDLIERTMNETDDAERAGRLAVLLIRAMAATNHPLSTEALHELHQRHRATSSADAIAWAAVQNAGGECEGYLPCYVERTNAFQGEYLRRHPNGQHVDEAVHAIGKLAEQWLTRIDKPDSFTPDKDCGDMKKWLTALRAAVTATNAPERQTTLGRLDEIGKSCGGTEGEHVAASTPEASAPPTPLASSDTAGPAAVPAVVSESQSVAVSLFGIAGAGLIGVAAMVMWRRRSAPSSNRITLQ